MSISSFNSLINGIMSDRALQSLVKHLCLVMDCTYCTCGGTQFNCDFFGKSSLGGNLIVQLCIFSCKDKTRLGYYVLGMYLRTIGIILLAFKRYVK